MRLAKKLPEICPYIKEYIMNSTLDILNQRMGHNYTILMLAVAYSRLYNNEQFIQILIDAGADINLRCARNRENNQQNVNALMFAASNDGEDSSVEALLILINAGVELNLQTDAGVSAIMFASANINKYSTELSVQILIQAKVNLNLQCNEGQTAIMYCVKNKCTEQTIKMFIDARADLNLINNNKRTVLDIFIKTNVKYLTDPIFKLLIEAGAKLNFSNYNIQKEVRACRKKIKFEKNKSECASLFQNNNKLLVEFEKITDGINFNMIKNNIELIMIEHSNINRRNRHLFKLNKINKYLQTELECYPGSTYLKQIEEHFDNMKIL